MMFYKSSTIALYVASKMFEVKFVGRIIILNTTYSPGPSCSKGG